MRHLLFFLFGQWFLIVQQLVLRLLVWYYGLLLVFLWNVLFLLSAFISYLILWFLGIFSLWFTFFWQNVIIVVFLQHSSHRLQSQFAFVHLGLNLDVLFQPIQKNFKYLSSQINNKRNNSACQFKLIFQKTIFCNQYTINTKCQFFDFQIQIFFRQIINNHLYQTGKYTLNQSSKVPMKKQKKKQTSTNKTVESNKRLPKTAKLHKILSKDYERNHTDLQNLCPRNKSNGSSLKNLKNNKVHNIYCPNPQIRIRKTMPCVYRNSSSIQYPKHLSLNSKEKLKPIGEKQSKGSREKDVKVNKVKAKIGLAIMKNIKIKEYLSPSNGFKKQYPCNKPLRQERKTTQALVLRSKTCSKNKTQTTTKKSGPLGNLPTNPLISKSSCITRNISRNNSKQKEYYQEAVGEKFKKKRGKEEKKLRKQAVYTSMKISSRNSVKFVERGEGCFVVVGGECGIGKEKDDEVGCELLWKTKSFRNLDLLNDRDIEQGHQHNEQDDRGKKQFSFKKNTNNNPHQLSIDNFLQCNQQPFRLQSQQSLKQRLTKLSLSLQQLRQQEFPNIQQLQSLNEFQTSLQQNMHFPITYPLSIFQLNKPISYPLYKHQLIQRAQIIDWLSIMASTMLLKTQSFQLAVAYFDAYCFGKSGKEDLSNDQARLIAVTCLTLAIKMDQRQLEHDIFNAYQTLQVGFPKQNIVNTQQSIVKRLKLNLNIPTLSLFLDYLTSLWDSFLDTHPLSPVTNLHFRSLHGRSYQNYRRALEISNSIIMDSFPQKYHYTQVVLSILYVICEQNLQRIKQQKVFERIDNFGRSLQRSAQRSSQGQGKENIPTFATQETLDGLSCSQVKENRVQVDNRSRKSHIPEGKDGKLLEPPKQSNEHKDIQHTRQNFNQTFSAFVKNTTNQDISQLDKPISYVRQFSQLEFLLEVDPRVYQQAQTYEDFMRYHSYSPHAKFFVVRRIEERMR